MVKEVLEILGRDSKIKDEHLKYLHMRTQVLHMVVMTTSGIKGEDLVSSGMAEQPSPVEDGPTSSNFEEALQLFADAADYERDYNMDDAAHGANDWEQREHGVLGL